MFATGFYDATTYTQLLSINDAPKSKQLKIFGWNNKKVTPFKQKCNHRNFNFKVSLKIYINFAALLLSIQQICLYPHALGIFWGWGFIAMNINKFFWM